MLGYALEEVGQQFSVTALHLAGKIVGHVDRDRILRIGKLAFEPTAFLDKRDEMRKKIKRAADLEREPRLRRMCKEAVEYGAAAPSSREAG